MVVGRIAASSATLMVAFAAAACSSQHAAGAVASSPARAALGFYDSIRAAKQEAKQRWTFSCPGAEDTPVHISWIAGGGTRTARTTPVGDRWHVTVTARASSGSVSSTFEVRREGAGYCVAREVDSRQ